LQTFDRTQLLPVSHFSAHKEVITRILLSPDVKKLATCSADHTAKIWEVDLDGAHAQQQQQLEQQQQQQQQQTNGNASDSEDTMATLRPPQPLDLEARPQGQQPPLRPFPLEATLTSHQRWVWDCAFSADSAYLVTACSDHYARLWELHSQQIIRQYNGHHRGAVCVALNDYSEAR